MDRPARLPLTRDEFDEWSVYADWLQSRGDPRGERIALELTMPAEPDPARLAAFQARAASPSPARGVVPTFALGYLQTLAVPRSTLSYSVDAESLAHARALLATEDAALVEEVELAFHPAEHLPAVQALFAALPPSCRHVGLDLCGPIDAEAARELAAHLPPHVRELALSASGFRSARIGLTGMSTWIDDRFDAIELRLKRSTFDVALGLLEVDREVLVERAAQARHVRQQWTAVAAPFPPGRIELGRPGDAALVDLRRRCAIVLSRRRPSGQEEDAAPLPIRGLRAGRLSERHGVHLYATDPEEPGLALHAVSVALHRCGDTWTLTHQPWQTGEVSVAVGGVAVAPGELVAIGDGDRIDSEHWSFMLITHDVTRAARALLGPAGSP